MRIKLKESLSFIAKPDLLEFDIELINKVHVIKEGKFKQNIKASEYKKIMDAQVSEVEKVNEEVKKTAMQIKAEKKAQKEAKKKEEETVDEVVDEVITPDPLAEPEDF